MCAAAELFDCIVGKNLLIRRLNVVANHVLPKESAPVKNGALNSSTCLPTMPHNRRSRNGKRQELEREQKMQTAMLTIKKKFGKNAILRGMNLEEGATAKDRNGQIGGHRA